MGAASQITASGMCRNAQRPRTEQVMKGARASKRQCTGAMAESRGSAPINAQSSLRSRIGARSTSAPNGLWASDRLRAGLASAPNGTDSGSSEPKVERRKNSWRRGNFGRSEHKRDRVLGAPGPLQAELCSRIGRAGRTGPFCRIEPNVAPLGPERGRSEPNPSRTGPAMWPYGGGS